MINIQAFPYMGFVRFDLIHKEFDREFNIYFDDHIQELANKPGYSTSWRTREWRGSYNAGVMEQEYQQIYAITEPTVFKSFPTNPPPVTEDVPFRRDITNWGRVFYRVLNLVEKDSRMGRCWARCEYQVRGDVEDEAKFLAASAQHLQRVLDLPGIHRAWQMQHVPTPAQIGADPAGKFLLMYEIDAPENFFDPSLDEERLPLKVRQDFAGRHFARLLKKAEPQR